MERRRQNIRDGIQEKEKSLKYEIKEEEIWDESMQLQLHNLIMEL